MSHRPKRSLLLAAALLALALGGCGGGEGDESTSTSQSATAAEQQQAPEQAKEARKPEPEHTSTQSTLEKQGSKQGKGEEQGSNPKRDHITTTTPPISSAAVQGSKSPAPGVKTTKGADNSVQTYGTEASEAARTEAALVLQSYLNARLQEDWGSACSYLAQRPKEQLQQQPSVQPQGQSTGVSKEPSSCPEAMATLSKGVPSQALAESAQINKVLSFRVEGDVPGDPSFLLYLGLPNQTLYSMPMYLEGGEWKVGLVLPSALPV